MWGAVVVHAARIRRLSSFCFVPVLLAGVEAGESADGLEVLLRRGRCVVDEAGGACAGSDHLGAEEDNDRA